MRFLLPEMFTDISACGLARSASLHIFSVAGKQNEFFSTRSSSFDIAPSSAQAS